MRGTFKVLKNIFTFFYKIIVGKSSSFVFIILLLTLSSSAAAKEDYEKIKKDYFLSQSLKVGKKPIQSAFFSPNGQHAIVLSRNSSVEIFSIQNGKKLQVISNYEHKAISLVLHVGGKLAVTGGQDDTIRIWSVDQAIPKDVLRGHLSAVSVLAIDAGGEILASGSLDGIVKLWDMKKKEMLKSTKVISKSSIKSLTFHPNGKTLAVGGKDGSLQFRSVPEMELITTLSGHEKSINDLEFNSRGDVLVSCSEEGNLIIWDWKVKKKRFKINFEEAVSTISIHPKLGEIVVGTAGGSLETWNIAERRLVHQITEAGPFVNSLGYDKNGKRIISALEDGTVQIWENGISLNMKTLSAHKRSVELLDFSSNNRFLISFSSDKSVRIWDLKKNESVKNFDIGNLKVQDIRFAPGGQSFVTASTDSSLIIWNAKDGSRIGNLKFHKGKINTLSFHPEDSVLLSGGSDKHWVLWDFESEKLLLSRKGHSSQILTSSFSPDGKHFATAGNDTHIKIWNFPQGELLVKLNGHNKAVTTMDFSPDGKLLASGAKDNQIFLWKIEPEISKTPFRKLEGHRDVVNQVLFSKDGKALITISKDKTMRLWNVKSGKLLRILHGDSMPLVAAVLSPDGELIAFTNLTNDITILEFPTDIPKLHYNRGDISKTGETDTSSNLNISDSEPEVSGSSYMNLENFKDIEKQSMTKEELQAYALAEKSSPSTSQIELQQRLNLLLKVGNTCLNSAEMEKLALKILSVVPDDLAAYHALVKTSILKQDIAVISLIVSLGFFAKLDQETYDYLPELEVRNIFENFRLGLFDQSFVRQGNIQKLKLSNCKEKLLSVNFSETSRNLRYPVEFLTKINSIPRLIDLREFLTLPEEEFQNRIFIEIERILKNDTPLSTSYLPRTHEDISKKFSAGTLKINLEKAQTWKNDGMASFSLRKERGQWQTFQTDKDNKLVMILPAGSYSLKFAGVLRKTFFLFDGIQLDLSIE